MIYQYGGETHAVRLEALPDGGYRAYVDDRSYEVVASPSDGAVLLALNGRQVKVYVAARGGERYVSISGISYTLTVPEPRSRRASAAGAGDLTAQMPGQVREVFVQTGETVMSGQTLLLLEAMKMEIRVTAPADGRVKRVLVQTGAVVDRGQRLVEME